MHLYGGMPYFDASRYHLYQLSTWRMQTQFALIHVVRPLLSEFG